MDKQQTLDEITEIIALQEDAIQKHPAKTSALYIEGRDAFMFGFSNSDRDEEGNLKEMSLTTDDHTLMTRYIMSSSFISAWYHLNGQQAERDKAAHSCVTLISSLGPNSEQTMKYYIDKEQLWRKHLSPGGNRKSSCLGSAALAVVFSGIMMWLLVAVL